jgi:Protein of unknown function (DUF1761)
MEFDVNYLAVLVAGLVYMGVGAIWYGPLFGKTWMGLVGITEESMKKMPLSPLKSMGLGLVTALIMACTLSKLVGIYVAVGVSGAWSLAFMIWFGFMMTNTASSFIWEGKPLKLFLINASMQLVAMFLMALVLVLWQ